SVYDYLCYFDMLSFFVFFFQAEDGIRDATVTGVQTCALPIYPTRLDPGHGSSRMFATPAAAASEAGPCTSTPSPARPSGRASTARRGSAAHPTADSRGSSAVSDPAGPSQSRADPIGADSSMPSRA